MRSIRKSRPRRACGRWRHSRNRARVRRIGLCNVRLEDIETARDIVDVATVQVELSPLTQTSLKNGVVAYCARHGIRVIAHSPLGGHRRTKRTAKLPVLQAIAKRHGVSAHEIALAWLRRIDPIVLPIPGATRVESLVSSLHALDVTLTEEDVAELDALMPAGRVVREPSVAVTGGVDREGRFVRRLSGSGEEHAREILGRLCAVEP